MDDDRLPAPRLGDAGDVAELSNEYDLRSELGRGGTAVVYRALDRALGRDVAIKVVHPRPTSPGDDAVARLAREARTVAQLQHPHIVTVFAVRRLRSGGLALIMQLVPGSTLKAVIQRDGPLSPERAERILHDVAQALAYAHARGVVHRDVKPENIFLDQESGRALLSDFGIARTDQHESLTLTGTALGTPFYMSPEQVEGGPLDGRSDLYSLGLVAWEMLTGQRPWDGESLYNVIFKQKHEELPPIEALRRGVPLRMQYLVERMLQKRPAARWAGADGLLAQLGHAVLPSDYGRWQQTLQRRVETHRAGADERAAVSRARPPVTSAATVRFPRRAVGDEGAPGPDARMAPSAAPSIGAADARATRIDTIPESAASNAADSRPHVAPPLVSQPLVAAEADASPAFVRYADAEEPSWSRDDPPSVPWTWHRRVGALASALVVAATLASAGGWWIVTGRPAPWAPVARVTATPADDAAPSVAQPPSAAVVTLDAASGSDGATASLALLASRATTSARLAGAEAPSGGVALRVGHSGAALSAGGRHACVLTHGAVLYCWGANDVGQLGDASDRARPVPVRVVGDLAFVQVAAGTGHTCAVTASSDAYCWGNDSRGQLGDAMTVRRVAPVRVAGPERFTQVAAGGQHSCGVTIVGEIACWGANDRGQLGNGGSTLTRTIPVGIRLPNGDRATAVATGGNHSCALGADERAYCWGANASGQLGDGSRTTRGTPVAVSGGHRFLMLAAGSTHTCGVTTDRLAWCWGANDGWQVGTPDAGLAALAPVQVVMARNVAPVQIAAGTAHSCVVSAVGEAWCWGRNGSGQLGAGSRSARSLPRRVPRVDALAAIAAASGHSCALTTTGQVVCWGLNSDGQIGDSARVLRTTATAVRLVAPVLSPSVRGL